MREGLCFSPRWEAIDQSGVPAVAHRPRAVRIHAIDKTVDPASIVSGARTLARFIAWFVANGGL